MVEVVITQHLQMSPSWLHFDLIAITRALWSRRCAPRYTPVHRWYERLGRLWGVGAPLVTHPYPVFCFIPGPVLECRGVVTIRKINRKRLRGWALKGVHSPGRISESDWPPGSVRRCPLPARGRCSGPLRVSSHRGVHICAPFHVGKGVELAGSLRSYADLFVLVTPAGDLCVALGKRVGNEPHLRLSSSSSLPPGKPITWVAIPLTGRGRSTTSECPAPADFPV